MNNIKKYINDSGYRSNYVADRIGCSPSDISHWIAGERSPSRERLKKLAKLLRVPMNELFPVNNCSRIYRREL